MILLPWLFIVSIHIISLRSETANGVNDQVIKIVKSYDAIKLEKAQKVPSTKLVEEIFKKVAEQNSTEKIIPSSAKFMSNDYSSKCSFMNGGTPQSYGMQLDSRIHLGAYDQLRRSVGYSKEKVYLMPDIQCRNESLYWKCDSAYPWRSIDGSCNNKWNPWWGAALTPYQRFAEPAYDDGYNAPRKYAKDGSKLPNPRKVAMYVHAPEPTRSDWSHMFLWFAQFLIHDVTKIASTVYYDGNQKYCKCGSADPDCISIPIPYEDYWNKDQKCISVTRSAPAARYFDCYMGPREQLNLASSWLDLGLLYGSSLHKSKELRSYERGLLKVSYNKYSKLEHLPYRDYVKSCKGLKPREKCYNAGDSRHEDNAFLNTIHTIFLREHNRVARKLAYWNPYWNDEMTFQVARKIVIAEYQNIVYAEFLPLLLGQNVAQQFNLLPNYEGYFMGYDSQIYPNTDNEFGAAAARFGHTLIKNYQVRADMSYDHYSNKSIDYYIFNQEIPEYGGGINSLALGALSDWSYYSRPQVNDRLNNWLFDGLYYKETGTKRFSLPALNIQRGRDHGLAPYVAYRDLCGLGRPYSFEDLTNIPKDVIYKLKKVYKNVEDIDLWTGMVSEYPLKGAAVGATQACILAKGFRDWKYGDRWWFENGNEEYIRFTPEQLAEIKKTSFSTLLCNNLEVEYVQELAFLWPNRDYNQWKNCREAGGIDFQKWSDMSYSGGALYSGASYSGASYSAAPYSEASYSEASYSGAPYQGAPYSGAPYQGAPYSGAPYQGAPYSGVPYQGAPYSGAPYQGAPYSGAPYQGAPYSGAPYQGAPYSGAPYQGAPYSGVSY